MSNHNIIDPLRIAAASAILLPAAMSAQLHENIEVEGKYVPDIIRIDKINTFPVTEARTMDSDPLPYQTEGVVADLVPGLTHMPPTGWRATRTVPSNRGYLDLSLGSWLNSGLSAGYRFLDTENTTAGVSLQFNSTSLWEPRLSEATGDIRRERYDGAISLYGSHRFRDVGRLDAAVDWQTGYFNYYGFNPWGGGYGLLPSDGKIQPPTQTFNEAGVRIGWHNDSDRRSLTWSVAGGVRHTAWRALYLPLLTTPRKGDRETMVWLTGGVRNPWESGSAIGLDAEADLLVYANAGKEVAPSIFTGWGAERFGLSRPDNYGQVSVTPYYSFQKGLLNIRLGAEVDFTFNAGEKGHRFPVFHIAPDVRVDYRKGGIALYLHMLGGNELQTLSRARQLDYYTLPALSSTRPVYTPLDASAGVGIGPFAGFSLEAAFRYRISRGVPVGGWYQQMLNTGFNPAPGMTTSATNLSYSLDPTGINLHGFSIYAAIDYKPLKMVEIHAEGSYQPQKGETGYFNGLDRPRLTAGISAAVRPVEKLRIYAGYDYRGVRTIHAQSYEPTGLPSDGGLKADIGEKRHQETLRLPDLTLLNAGASWDFTPSFSLRVDATNLLNRHDAILPGLPDEGISVTGGVSILF